ncbi:hypothetical protein ACN0IV_12755 [Trabulsiella odontotermitis]|uniref:hypothetical protein n=1 Tax=Trabulsiella odontotermitis TaxID=379893 RepID=UPI003ACE17B3
MPAISFQPFKNMGAMGGLFNTESRGLTQGDAHDDPAVRLQLCSGSLDDALATPVWAGMGVTESIAPTDSNVSGSVIKAATATVCNAFSVINQAYHGITTAGNPVPLFLAGGSVHYFRIGSGARIPLPISDAVAALATTGDPVGADGFVWDLTNNLVDVASSASSANPTVAIKLLQVSLAGNLTVKQNTDGSVIWETDKPCGLFLI